ncbi:chaperone protein DnaJ [Novimethylophilus kurashikiensis]|uniref:Chaperone protein DnaJ n=1 Tax=Novimethylophilus kurashikiensis TaxID=1825523 RepID=A0A2R5F8A3_9PROT|nr:hypothetical protein [Novimethylophilus kurashikiensis]GBG14265.1 chaperone protein DnaJ [Novimethylophilus kurashikiensis]
MKNEVVAADTETKDEYAGLARKEIQRFIQRSTRFEPENVSFSSDNCLDVTFEVRVRHVLQMGTNHSTYTGIVEANPGDYVVQSAGEYDATVTSLISEAVNNPNILANLAPQIVQEGYGAYRDQKKVGHYSKRVIRTYTCARCYGDGEYNCTYCNGTRKQSCSWCYGTGYQTRTITTYDSNGHAQTGHRREACMYCDTTGRMTCNTCRGRGKLTCGDCGGHGRFTNVAEAEYFLKPDYKVVSINVDDADVTYALTVRADLPTVVNSVATLLHRDVVRDEPRRCVTEQATFSTKVYKSDVTVSSETSKMVVYGNKCAIADAGTLVEQLVTPDLEALELTLLSFSIFNIKKMFGLAGAGRSFMQSEVHQQAVEHAPASFHVAADLAPLSDKLAKALQPEYLLRALLSLKQMKSAIKSTWLLLFLAITSVVLLWKGLGSNQAVDVTDLMVNGVVMVGMAWLISAMMSWCHIRWIGGKRLAKLK